MESEEKSKGNHVSPALRKAISTGTTPVETSKFERFLSSRSAANRQKSDSSWGIAMAGTIVSTFKQSKKT